MKIERFNENVDTSGFKVKLKFKEELEIDFNDITKMDRYEQYYDDSVNSAIFISIEQYLYENG